MGALLRQVLVLAVGASMLVRGASAASVSGMMDQDRPPPSSLPCEEGVEAEKEEPAAVIDFEVDAVGDAVEWGMDKAALLSGSSTPDQTRTFPLPGEEGNFEVYKGFRDIAAAEDFTAADYLSIRGAVLALTPDDGDPTTFPMCELFKVGAPLRLHCVMIGLSMRGMCRRACVRAGEQAAA